MKTFLYIAFILNTVVLFGQKGKTANQIRRDFNNAKFITQIKLTKTTFFSSTTKMDTVVLVVDIGLICNSKSYITIITFDNKIIYKESFKTSYFTRQIFEPDSVPVGGQDVYDKFVDKYVKSISKTKFEKYTLSKINSFLKGIKADRTQLVLFKNDAEDKVLFNQVLKEKVNRIIWFPCFECDEGVRYFAYSKTKERAVKILETD